ncbi:hypothetical protein [Roseateles sp. BYS96W]|uniref:DUF1877 family protein n=1 Tax=Pelomonas nitida TaxID=3299027 RepID=A0ABW7GAV3_9BURK
MTWSAAVREPVTTCRCCWKFNAAGNAAERENSYEDSIAWRFRYAAIHGAVRLHHGRWLSAENTLGPEAMARTFPAFAFAMDSGLLPDRLETPEKIYELLEVGYKQGNMLSGGSYKGWLALVVECISKRYGISCLDFLYCEPWLCEDGCYATVLGGDRLNSVVETIRELFDRFETHPSELIAIADQGRSEYDILECLHNSTASLNPKVDDGDDFNYLFAYLKSLLALCETAIREGKLVVYAQFDGG